MFDLSSLQYNSAYPGLFSIIITVMSSIVLGALLAFTYEKTSREVERPDHFIQAMILVTIVAATVIQAIGDSVARGLGMIGALSIIRFRTTVRNPRNIVFMFSAIAIGIATGIFGLQIALIGTLGFSLTAFALYYSSFSPANDFFGKMRLELDTTSTSEKEVNKIFKKNCSKFVLNDQAIVIKRKKAESSKLLTETLIEKEIEDKETEKKEHIISTIKLKPELGKNFAIVNYNYDFKLKKNISYSQFAEELSSLPGVNIKDINMQKSKSDRI